MAGRVRGGEFAVTGTAQSLTSLLGLARQEPFTEVALRAWKGNVDEVFFGKSNVTLAANRLGWIDPGEAVEVATPGYFTNTDEIHLIGTVGDRVFCIFTQ